MSGEEQTNEGTAAIAANGRVDRNVMQLGEHVMLNTDDVRHHTEVGTGYSKDAMLGKAADEIDALRLAISTAYGHLWHVNNEPGTPNQHSPERAAFDARKILRDLLTHEQRGEAINRVRELLVHNA